MVDLNTIILPVSLPTKLRGVVQRFFCVLLLVLLGTGLPASAAERRVALVVGNKDYADKPLRNPVNDAELMQRTLQGLGFDVSLVRNADRRTLLAGLREFEAKARNADIALFFYAGHGAQVGGANYLIPLNAQIRAESDVPDEAVDATSVLRRIEDAKARVGLVILDACRDNPYTGTTRSSSRGLARMSVPTGSIVAYATAPGYTADDGKGANGVYTEQLTRHLNQSGLDLREVFDRTAIEVERLTNGKQKPREDVGLRGRIVLNPGAGTQIASLKPEPVMPIAQPDQGGGLSLEDLEREENTRKQWAQWQAKMKADFDKTAAFKGSADLQVKAWDRFLGNYGQDNPLSREDDDLRSRASDQREKAQRAVQQALVQVVPEAREATPPAGQTSKACAECPEMVVIPGGSFEMGSNATEREKPIHSVTVKSFELGKYEVTQGQWKAVMGSNPSRFKECGDTCPAEQVSWDDIQEYIKKLNAKSGQQYRLPSEAEWEYAARAGTKTKYSWGDDKGKNNANCDGCGSQWTHKTTAPVGQFKANGFGLHDMHGNVNEWVQDCWHGDYKGAPSDGSAWTSSCSDNRRVLRGGSWDDYPVDLRSAFRSWVTPDFRYDVSGFRLAKTLLTP